MEAGGYGVVVTWVSALTPFTVTVSCTWAPGRRAVSVPVAGSKRAACRGRTPAAPPMCRFGEPDQSALTGAATGTCRPLPCFDGNHAVVGSWLVQNKPCGLSLREDLDPITKNTSRFLPHAIIG